MFAVGLRGRPGRRASGSGDTVPSEIVQDVTGKSARAAGVTLGDLFVLQVARTPERIAVVDAEGGLTYEGGCPESC